MRNFAEPGVLQRLLRRDAVRGVVDKNLLEEVQKLLQKFSGRRDDVLETVSRLRLQAGQKHQPVASS
jgi:hypothetical protein